MKITVSNFAEYGTHIVFITEDNKQKVDDFKGKKNEITVRYEDKKTIIYSGIGKKKECTADILRTTAGSALRKANELKRAKVSLIDPGIQRGNKNFSYAILMGAILGSYSFSKYKSKKVDKIQIIQFVTKFVSKKEIHDINTIGKSVYFSRDLVNDNASLITPQYLAVEAKKISSLYSEINCEILNEKDIEHNKLGLLFAVGKGAPYPPRLIILKYKGNKKSKDNKVIVGKGVTFDSGGLNLKGSTHIETMRSDMSGAAAILGTMKAIAILKPKINVTGVIASAYNAIDGKSYIPGDIYQSYSGKSVEICNTDAEGRLILADAISYCKRKYNPTEIIDLATLTGAILYALGDNYAGLFSNNDLIAKELLQAGKVSGEKLWRMPLEEAHLESMKSELADLRNVSKLPKGCASSSTAAAFIQSFVEDTPWAHIDIAGTAFNNQEENGEIPKYGTGFGVRLLIQYLFGK